MAASTAGAGASSDDPRLLDGSYDEETKSGGGDAFATGDTRALKRVAWSVGAPVEQPAPTAAEIEKPAVAETTVDSIVGGALHELVGAADQSDSSALGEAEDLAVSFPSGYDHAPAHDAPPGPEPGSNSMSKWLGTQLLGLPARVTAQLLGLPDTETEAEEAAQEVGYRQRCETRWLQAPPPRQLTRRTSLMTSRSDTLYLAKRTNLFALLCCQLGMLFSVGATAYAYYWQDQDAPDAYVVPKNNVAYYPNVTDNMSPSERQQLRSERWSPHYYAMKSPAAAAANVCYITCGAGIIALPALSGAHNSDVWTLLAFNMIFLGLASFSFHYHGDLLDHWSHRADLTFILVLIGALPFLAVNGLNQAYAGHPAPPRDPVALITKGCAIALGGYSFVKQEEMWKHSMYFLTAMSVASVIINNLSMVLMTRRAVALTEKRTLLQRWWRGYPPRISIVDVNPDTIDWNTWEWREASKCLGIKCSRGAWWPSHETWAAIELALPRFLLGLATIGVGQLVNSESDAIRDEAWGDKNLTAQWEADENLSEDEIEAAIERRKVYDYLHGSWQFLSALFLMRQTLDIMVATTGRIDRLPVYAGRAETMTVGQTWAIVVAVFLAWYLEASSDTFFILWFCVAVFGSILSFSLLVRTRLSRYMKRRGRGAYCPQLRHLCASCGAWCVAAVRRLRRHNEGQQAQALERDLALHLVETAQDHAELDPRVPHQPLAAPLPASGYTRPVSRARSHPAALAHDQGPDRSRRHSVGV